jgi:hypothetical protein
MPRPRPRPRPPPLPPLPPGAWIGCPSAPSDRGFRTVSSMLRMRQVASHAAPIALIFTRLCGVRGLGIEGLGSEGLGFRDEGWGLRVEG